MKMIDDRHDIAYSYDHVCRLCSISGADLLLPSDQNLLFIFHDRRTQPTHLKHPHAKQ